MDISEFSRLNDQNAYSRHPWETSRKNVLLGLLKQSAIVFPVDRIVDIGSGDAYVIHNLVEAGLAKEYYAIDNAYTPEVIEQLKINNNHSEVAYVHDLEQYFHDHPTQGHTLYLCMDVLEHLQNENEILDYLHQGNNDYFFAVPAFQSVFSQHDVLLGHYRRYMLGQLENVLRGHDFRIVDKGYYFTTLLIFRWIDKLLQKDKKASIDNWTGSKFKSALINGVLQTDFALTQFLKKIGITVQGLSCYCLCKK